MKGKVYLVGAGPGDYKLITIRGMECIKEADVIVYDRLANEKYLKETKENCEIIYVGKKSSNHTMKQEEINRLLAEKAEEGMIVTRLKGGDPYVFGRGGEEGEYLVERDIDFEVVPGITSAIGGLCYAGIPITHRGIASSFHVITGHLKDSSEDLNWEALAALKGTLVFLMGMSNLEKITGSLLEKGKSKDTPVAIINWGTRYNQKVATGTLDTINGIVLREKISSPSVIAIGEVVNLRNKLNFFENKPLLGKNVVVTRARAQSSDLVEAIESLGGNAVEVPTIKISEIEPNEDLTGAISNINKFNYIIFTSVNGVNIFFRRLFKLGYDSRVLHKAKIVAIGKSTKEALNKYGINSDITPKKFISEEIVLELIPLLNREDRILVPRAKEARSYLVDELRNLCEVHEIKTYNTLQDSSGKENFIEALNKENINYITFTSSSTVNNFISILGVENTRLLQNIKIISIGPVTSKTIKNYNLNIYKEAKEYTINGVLKCILDDTKE